ncbi:MAG: hypothetical protein Q9M82_01200 [Mariprofundus sp.]|nr:hypothetical protein [Mariprofundus sp.]
MIAKKTKVPEKKKGEKKPAGAFDKIVKHSTWSLLTGCHTPFVHHGIEDDEESTTAHDKKDSDT